MEEGSPKVSLSLPNEEINSHDEASENEYSSNTSADNRTTEEHFIDQGVSVAIISFVVIVVLLTVTLWIRFWYNWNGKPKLVFCYSNCDF